MGGREGEIAEEMVAKSRKGLRSRGHVEALGESNRVVT